jgi:hypothetical protein
MAPGPLKPLRPAAPGRTSLRDSWQVNPPPDVVAHLAPRIGRVAVWSLLVLLIGWVAAASAFGPPASARPTDAGPDAAFIGATATGMQIRALGLARAQAAAGDAAAARGAAEALWINALSPDIEAASLALLLEVSAADLPDDRRGRFVRTLAPEVLRAARVHRVPPSVALSQAILESGWGQSRLARDHHNYFGIKGGGVRFQTKEHRRGRLRAVRAGFASFTGPGEAVWHHARLLGEHKRYAKARPLWSEWRAYLAAIAPIYASSPRYSANVSFFVERYRLDRWDALIVAAVTRDAARREARELPPVAVPALPEVTGDALADAAVE